MIDLVNGYVCMNCSDVALAQKGINPANPQANPSSPGYDPKAAAAKSDHGPAFKLDGALSTTTGQPSASGQPSSAPGQTAASQNASTSSAGSGQTLATQTGALLDLTA